MGSCFSRRKKNDATVVHSGSPAKDAKLVAIQKQQMQQLQAQEPSPTAFDDSSTVSQCPAAVQNDGHGDGSAPLLRSATTISASATPSMPAERICAVSSVSPPLGQKQDEDEIFLCVEGDDIAIGEEGEARSPKGSSLKRARSEEEPVHAEAKRRSFKLEEEGDGDSAPNHAVAKGQSAIHEESGSTTASFLDGLLHNNSSPPENLDGSSWTAMSLDQQQQDQKQQYMDSLSADFFALKHRYLSSCASSSSSSISPLLPKQEKDEEEADPSSLHRSSVPLLDHGITISPSALLMQEEEASSSLHRSSVPPLDHGIMKGFALSPPRSMDPSSVEVLDSRYSSEDGQAFLARSQPILEEEEEQDDDDDDNDGKEMTFSSSSDESDTFEFMQALSECCSPQRDRGIPEHSNAHILALERKHGEQPRDQGRGSPRLSSSSASSIDDDLPAYVEGQGFHLTAPSAAKRAAEGEVPLLSMEDIMVLMDKDELNEERLMSFLSMAGHRDATDTKTPSCPPSDVVSEASFEFKIGSTGSTPHSTPSTPMLSAGSTPKRVTQLSPLMLTPEEIAEIWGVFELKQHEQSVPSHHFH